VSINAGSIKTAEGSAIVKIGNTTVVCGIKAVSKMFSVLIYNIVFK
jgi:exosome complex RNA-binding protein Rrp42 (RNase PH superfamily)